MKFKTIIILLLLLVFTIILFQNLEKVSIQLLFWEFEMVPLFILFPLTLFLGVIIGFLLSSSRKKKKQQKDNNEEDI